MDSQITAADFLLDLKVLLKEYYIGTFTADCMALKVCFENGQTFIINVTEA